MAVKKDAKKPAKAKAAKSAAKTVRAKTVKPKAVKSRPKIKTTKEKPKKAAAKTKPKPKPVIKPKAAAKKKDKTPSMNQDIKEAQKQGKLVLGSRTVFKGIKGGIVTDVFHTTNIPEALLKDLNYYAKVSKIAVNRFNGNSAQLGELCGKPFKILLAAIKK